MDKREMIRLLEETPIVAALKNREGLSRAVECECQVIFILFGDIVSLGEVVSQVKQAGKVALVHIDLIDGLSGREVAVDFIRKNTQADGIISTKAPLIRYAKQKGMITVQRFFLLDSMALQSVQRQMEYENADFIEVLPGVMPKVIRRLVSNATKPVIAGGLIGDKEDVVLALSAGAVAVSSTNPGVWMM